jgi:hypothetical protein
MSSEYDPLIPDPVVSEDDLEPVRERFRRASGPYLRSPWSWLAWALVLPAAAFATPTAAGIGGPAGVLVTWSVAILAGGAVEVAAILGAGGRAERTPLAAWVLRLQGNLSLVALALSALALWQGMPWALPGIWLLLLGHSFYLLGGLAFPPMRTCGVVFQVGGLAALWPGFNPLLVFALATAAGNLWMAVQVWRARRTGETSRGARRLRPDTYRSR